jgi:hypothetical protein
MQETRSQVLTLYRTLLRQCERFADGNVRAYAKRRVRAGFRENQPLQDPEQIAKALEDGKKDLAMVQRQTTISQLYPPPPYVLETPSGVRFTPNQNASR